MSLRIVMLGAPGAGKGTQAKRIAVACKLPHISTGDIFRANLSEGTPLGLQVRQYMDAGNLVPDALTCEIVADRITWEDCQNGYILDGFPRSLPQAEEFDRLLKQRNEIVDVAINIDVTDEEIIDRLSARRTCPSCGRIYNIKFSPPKQGNKCDDDQTELTQRIDDCEETIRQRLNVYHETTEPIIEHYRKQNILKSVTGTGSTPEGVFSKIEEILAATGAS